MVGPRPKLCTPWPREPSPRPPTAPLAPWTPPLGGAVPQSGPLLYRGGGAPPSARTRGCSLGCRRPGGQPGPAPQKIAGPRIPRFFCPQRGRVFPGPGPPGAGTGPEKTPGTGKPPAPALFPKAPRVNGFPPPAGEPAAPPVRPAKAGAPPGATPHAGGRPDVVAPVGSPAGPPS